MSDSIRRPVSTRSPWHLGITLAALAWTALGCVAEPDDANAGPDVGAQGPAGDGMQSAGGTSPGDGMPSAGGTSADVGAGGRLLPEDAAHPDDAAHPEDAAHPMDDHVCCADADSTCTLVPVAEACRDGVFMPEATSCDPNPCTHGCQSGADCVPGQSCDADGQCVADCSDAARAGGHHDPATAAPLVLVDFAGAVAGDLTCPGWSDFYSVQMFQAGRMQVVATATDPEAGDLGLRLYDTDGLTLLLERDTPGMSERLRFPEALRPGVPAAGEFFVEVFSAAPAAQGYALDVRLVDALGSHPCFSDDPNPGNQAIALPWLGNRDETYTFSGSICGNDEAWFTFVSPHRHTGVTIELVVHGLLGSAVLAMYNDLSVRNLGTPDFISGRGEPQGDGSFVFRLGIPKANAQLPEGNWYVRVRPESAGDVLEDYDLSIELLAQGDVCAVDAAEPNDGPAQSAALDLLPGIAAGGLVTRGEEQAVPLALSLCPQEEDWFSITVEEGDQIAVRASSDVFSGEVEIALVDANGAPLGATGVLTQTGSPIAPARLFGAAAGLQYVSVRSLGDADAGEYALFIFIQSGAGICGGDVAEVGPGRARNDSAARATPLVPVDAAGLRFETEGAICDFDGPDRDWYRVRIPTNDTALCVQTEGILTEDEFTVSLFDGEPGPVVDVPCATDDDCSDPGARFSLRCLPAEGVCGCETDADCDVDRDGLGRFDGHCVERRCQQPILWTSESEGVLSRNANQHSGDYLVLVEGDSGELTPYAFQATLKPPAEAGAVCVPDARQRANGVPVDLGAGRVTICDAWICPGELMDPYEFEIPPGELDRTVLVTSEDPDAEIELVFELDAPAGVLLYERPFDVIADPRGECVNVHGNAAGGTVGVQVYARRPGAGGNGGRHEYVLRILPTDLDANPEGRCGEFVQNLGDIWSFELPAP